MFQDFENRSDGKSVANRVRALREILRELGLDGVLVPRADEHQGEYVPAGSERLAWLTGFTGSAGTALVMAESAHLFVDGRYTLQAAEQTDTKVFIIEDLIQNPPSSFLKNKSSRKLRIGIDPWLHTVGQAGTLEKALHENGGELVRLGHNPVDHIWNDRPNPPLEQVRIHDIAYAGIDAQTKIANIARKITDSGADVFVAADPASIAWAFNIRGSDVPHTPLPLGFAILRATDKPMIFMDKRKMTMETEAYLAELAQLRPPSRIDEELAAISNGKKIAIDPTVTADQIRMLVEENGGAIVKMDDPAGLDRACKNDAEIAGARNAHVRDGAAMVRYLAWLDSRAPGELDEISAVEKLEEFRRDTGEKLQMPLREISFDTISGFGRNGAIIHYRVSRDTNQGFSSGSLFLVDSGGQYDDGTTDITRTVAIGTPSAEMCERYTLVLKGLIAISTLRFPPKTRGMDIDAFARSALWRHGLDYAHGTGHGVGSYLSVHEGPQRIARTGTVELQEGMILSNEPGYYKEGAYGIRLENLILVEAATMIDDGEKPMHGFETLTLAPFDTRLIDNSLLERWEIDWLNTYHERVRETLSPLLGKADSAWLKSATRKLR